MATALGICDPGASLPQIMTVGGRGAVAPKASLCWGLVERGLLQQHRSRWTWAHVPVRVVSCCQWMVPTLSEEPGCPDSDGRLGTLPGLSGRLGLQRPRGQQHQSWCGSGGNAPLEPGPKAPAQDMGGTGWRICGWAGAGAWRGTGRKVTRPTCFCATAMCQLQALRCGQTPLLIAP